MEYLDLLDENGQPTGETVPRGTILSDDRNILAVHIYLQHSDGRYLIQQRSLNKKIWPGRWDTTSGAVSSGERSHDTAIREVKEELGLDVPPSSLRYLGRFFRHPAFWDVWYAKMDCAPERCILQEDEVSAVKLVTKAELIELFETTPFKHTAYQTALEEQLPET